MTDEEHLRGLVERIASGVRDLQEKQAESSALMADLTQRVDRSSVRVTRASEWIEREEKSRSASRKRLAAVAVPLVLALASGAWAMVDRLYATDATAQKAVEASVRNASAVSDMGEELKDVGSKVDTITARLDESWAREQERDKDRRAADEEVLRRLGRIEWRQRR